MRKGWRWGLLAAGMLLAACNKDGTAERLDVPRGNPPRSDARIEMRLVSPDESGVTARLPNGSVVKLVGPPIITTSAIASVRQEVGEDGLASIYYTFTESSGPRIQRATEGLVGRAAVMTVDGEPISQAMISGPFGKSMMTSGVDPDEARELVFRMTGQR
ncbi:MAG: SecDF P1 head subdomain-containing protein [Stenotrophomonas sp.]|uniref:SecDF P1 head subdomain-containing protein n=1 Tax=Stenotrophomonas sp. TaxID=69392 RepID=UPI003D6D1D28